jgi:hypothetical protein
VAALARIRRQHRQHGEHWLWAGSVKFIIGESVNVALLNFTRATADIGIGHFGSRQCDQTKVGWDRPFHPQCRTCDAGAGGGTE